VCLVFVTLSAIVARNLTRGSLGRKWMAIRDMDIAAEIIGVNPLGAKLSAFAISSFFVGLSGALFFAVYLGAVEVGEVFGIFKAYCTRVGSGPFPTELSGRLNDQLTERGGEFGTTTGRRRRCGWFDGVIGRYAVQVNGLDCLAVTKLDVLDELDEIQVCVAYELDGERIEHFPSSSEDFARCQPIFETMPGWQCSTEDCRKLEDLPKAAMDYLRFLADLMEVPIAIVSLGASRDQTIVVEDPIHGPKRALLSA